MCQVFYENLTCSASHLPKANFVWLVFNGMCQVFYENLTCSASHLPKANFVWLVFNVGKEKL